MAAVPSPASPRHAALEAGIEPYWLAVANVRQPNAANGETDYVIDGRLQHLRRCRQLVHLRTRHGNPQHHRFR
jgi:hypothetical protein